MGYFDNVTAASFKEDSRDRTIFFPWGIMGKGYILRDKGQEQELRRFIKFHHMISIAFLAFLGSLPEWWFLCLAFTSASIIVWMIKIRRSVNGLPTSDERLRYRESINKILGIPPN